MEEIQILSDSKITGVTIPGGERGRSRVKQTVWINLWDFSSCNRTNSPDGPTGHANPNPRSYVFFMFDEENCMYLS